MVQFLTSELAVVAALLYVLVCQCQLHVVCAELTASVVGVSCHEAELRTVVPFGKLRLNLSVLFLHDAEAVVAVELVGVRQLEIY